MSHILAVDDDPDLCRLVQTALERDGHQVAVRCSGREEMCIRDRRSEVARQSKTQKQRPSSDCRLQLACTKLGWQHSTKARTSAAGAASPPPTIHMGMAMVLTDGEVGALIKVSAAVWVAMSYARLAAARLRPGALRLLALLPVVALDRKSTRLNSSHITRSRMPSSA